MTDFQPKRGDRSALSTQELEVLDMKVLPKARQWMLEYPDGSPLWDHANQTRLYWQDVA